MNDTTPTPQITIADAPERDRFEVSVDGTLAGFTEYVDRDEERVFPHTEIDPAFAEQGLAMRLIRTALDETRETGRAAIPQCRAVRAFMKRNREYVDLVPAERRGEFGLS